LVLPFGRVQRGRDHFRRSPQSQCRHVQIAVLGVFYQLYQLQHKLLMFTNIRRVIRHLSSLHSSRIQRKDLNMTLRLSNPVLAFN
jgi:hypothetical protein